MTKDSRKCPNCGAKITNFQKCEFCGSSINLLDAVSSDIEGDGKILPGVLSALQSNITLQSDNPSFEVETSIRGSVSFIYEAPDMIGYMAHVEDAWGLRGEWREVFYEEYEREQAQASYPIEPTIIKGGERVLDVPYEILVYSCRRDIARELPREYWSNPCPIVFNDTYPGKYNLGIEADSFPDADFTNPHLIIRIDIPQHDNLFSDKFRNLSEMKLFTCGRAFMADDVEGAAQLISKIIYEVFEYENNNNDSVIRSDSVGIRTFKNENETLDWKECIQDCEKRLQERRREEKYAAENSVSEIEERKLDALSSEHELDYFDLKKRYIKQRKKTGISINDFISNETQRIQRNKKIKTFGLLGAAACLGLLIIKCCV